MLKLLSLATLLFLSGCNQSEAFGTVDCDQKRRGAYMLCGAINQSSVNQALDAFESDGSLKRLFISSDGGSMRDQYRLLDYVDGNEIDIVVFNKCLSACFLMIGLTRQNVYVHPETIVGNHESPYALNGLLRSAGISDLSRPWKALVGASLEDFQAMSRRGVDERLFLGGLYYKNIQCIQDFEKDSQDRFITRGQLLTQFEYWVPSRDIFNKLSGKDIQGWWPKKSDIPAFEEEISRPFTYQASLATASEMYAHFSELEMCSNEP